MSDSELSRSDRVSISDSIIGIYKELTEGSNVEEAPFRTLKDVFMLAVCLGYKAGRRQTLQPGSRHTIRKEVFTETDYIMLRAIAVAATGDIEVLLRPSELLTIAEEYAQVGIREIETNLVQQSGRPLWNLTELLRSSSL